MEIRLTFAEKKDNKDNKSESLKEAQVLEKIEY